MKRISVAKGRRLSAIWLASAVGALLFLESAYGADLPAKDPGRTDPNFERWFKPQN